MFIRTISRVALATALLGCSAALHAEQHTVPLFVASGPGGDPQGVLRLVSEADTAATVAIHAIDDAGARIGPATLTLNALSAVELSATELQSGSAAKGLPAGLGSLSGGVRLVIYSDVPIVPSAYVRTADGTRAAMNATVFSEVVAGPDAHRYDVPAFYPASNVTQPSRLRLINPGDTPAQVTIAARDDTGAAATGGTVELTLRAGGARTLSAQQLEAGDSTAFTRRLGVGVGNWRLSVMPDRPIQAVNVTVGSDGEWRNLSTTTVSGWAPETAAAFEARFLGRAIVSRNGQDRVTFQVLANNRLTHAYMDDGVEVRQQSRFEYERTGRDAALLRLDYDAGLSCEARFHFGSRRSGWYAFACVDAEDRVEIWTGGTWLSLDAEATPLELGPGPDDLIYVEGTAIDALTLPAASGGDGELTYSLSPEVPGLSFDPDTRRLSGTPAEAGIWTMTYRVRDASGDTDWLYFVLAVDTATVGRETTHTVGATLSDLPSGSWTADVISNGSFSLSGGDATVRLNDGGYIEEGGHRYTCESSGGCVIENRRVTSGTVVQTASGTAPGGGVSGDHGDDRATATGVEAGSDTEGVLDAGDVDYFRVVVDAAGTLEAYTSGRTDTLGRLEDADGAELGTNDDGGAGTNFRISEDVSAGTYFVRVEGYRSRVTGDYTLHVRFTESSADTSPSFAAGSGPGDQSYTVGTAIDALMLPEAGGGDGPLTYSLSPSVPGLIFNATASVRRLTGTPTVAGAYDMTYRVRDIDGDTDTLSFTITVESAGGGGGGQETTHEVGDTLSDLPSGFWTPDVTSGGSFSFSGGNATVRLNEGGYIEEGSYRYTCQSSGGCVIENRSVTTGTIVQTASGTAPGSGGTPGGSDLLAPADRQAFNSRVVGNRLHGPGYYIDFPSAGRFLEDGGLAGSYSYSSTGSATGTLTQTYDDSTQYGGSCTLLLSFDTETTGTVSFTCTSGVQGRGSWTITADDVPPAPQVLRDGATDTSLTFGFSESFDAGETKAFDYHLRRKTPQGSWNSLCNTITNNSANSGRGIVRFGATGLQPGTVYEARYRSRNSSSCTSGSPGPWSLIGEGRTTGAAQGLGFTESGPLSRSIPENVPGGINVGTPVTAGGGDALTYSIGGVDAGSFEVVPETGQIRTSGDVWYDFETKNRYEVEVTVADDDGGRESIDVTIDLLDLAPN